MNNKNPTLPVADLCNFNLLEGFPCKNENFSLLPNFSHQVLNNIILKYKLF